MSKLIDELVSICWSKVTEGSYFRDLIFADLISKFVFELENVLELSTPLLTNQEVSLLKTTVANSPNRRINKLELQVFLQQLVGDDLESWLLRRSKLSLLELRSLASKRLHREAASFTTPNIRRSPFETRSFPVSPPLSPKPVREIFRKYQSQGPAEPSYNTNHLAARQLNEKDRIIEDLSITCTKYKQALEELMYQNKKANTQIKNHLQQVAHQNELIQSLSNKLKLGESKYDDALSSRVSIDLLLYKIPTLKQLRALRLLQQDRWTLRWYLFSILLSVLGCFLVANLARSVLVFMQFLLRLSLRGHQNDFWNDVATIQWWKAFSTLESTMYTFEDWLHYN